MAGAGLEIEAKIPVPSPRTLRARLRAQGYRPSPSLQETNWIFDDARSTLRRSGRLLRLRKRGAHWLLTAKGPRQLRGALKIRPESETAVAGGPQTRALLQLLGFRETFVYARRRTLWSRKSERGEVAFDQTPFGAYLELEGPPAWIRSTARALALDLDRAEPRSYPELYAAHAPSARRRPSVPRAEQR